MIVTLGEYRIRTAPMNYILEREFTVSIKAKIKPGEKVWRVVGYHSSYAKCIAAIPDEIILSDYDQSLDTAIQKISDLAVVLQKAVVAFEGKTPIHELLPELENKKETL